jgi:hypothetical protein
VYLRSVELRERERERERERDEKTQKNETLDIPREVEI